MRDERGEGRGPKDRSTKEDAPLDKGIENLEQIEYLLFQSTRGVHFMFENSEIAGILKTPSDEKKFFTKANMEKVQGLLSGFLECRSMQEKRSFLDRLHADDFELLVRAYFHLVENTILAHSNIRH